MLGSLVVMLIMFLQKCLSDSSLSSTLYIHPTHRSDSKDFHLQHVFVLYAREWSLTYLYLFKFNQLKMNKT